MTVTTKDGDRVTLSSSRSATEIGAVGRDDGPTAAAFLRSTSGSFSVEIDGSLDQEELADIRKALKLLAQSARRLDAEKLQRRLAHADLQHVASLSASVERVVQVIGGVLTVIDPA
jgi:hypothetical protein